MISVIVAIYNEEDFIPRCIESILRQTYGNLEILLVDDGSTDRSGEICDKYALQDSRCKVIHQKNSGIAGARNTGLQNMTGDFVMFVDGDDYIHPRFCEILRQTLVETGCPIAIADAERVPDDTNQVEPLDKLAYPPIILSQDELMQRLCTMTQQHHTDLMVWGKLYERRLLQDVFFQNIVGEDIEYNSRIFQKVSKGVFVDTGVYYWVKRRESVNMQPFSYRNIDELDVWLKCLNNQPDTESKYRGYFLKRLYKNILNIRLNTPKEFRQYAGQTIDRLIGDTFTEFKQNKHISTFFKITIILMCRFPFLYYFFRIFLEKKSRVDNIIKLRTLNLSRK